MTEKTTPTPETPTPDRSKNERFRYVYTKKSVKRRVNRRRLASVMLVFILVAFLVAGGAFGVLQLIEYNSFRVEVDAGSSSILSLSQELNEDEGLAKPSHMLSSPGPTELSDTTFSWLPMKTFLNSMGGPLTSEADNFVASTFFLSNVSDEQQEYREFLRITGATKNLEAAVRIMVIKTGYHYDFEAGAWDDEITTSYTVYALSAGDGEKDFDKNALPGQPEWVAYGTDPEGVWNEDFVAYHPDDKGRTSPWLTTPFLDPDNGEVDDQTYYPIRPGDVYKYTIVLWIEGTDPDTKNAVAGGRMGLTIVFTTNPSTPGKD